MHLKSGFLIIFFFLFVCSATGQITFVKTSSDTLNSNINEIVQTADSGYVAAGKLANDGYIMKMNKNGDIEWDIVLNGSYDNDIRSIKPTNDGGFIAAGKATIPGPVPFSDIYIVKLNSVGDTLWTRTYGDSLQESTESIIQTSDNGFLICGWTNSFFATNYHSGYVVKIDSVGNLQWSIAIGDSDFEILFDAIQTADNGFILIGHTKNNSPTQYSDWWIIKLDSNGNKLFEKTFGDSWDLEWAYDIISTTDGGFAIAGRIINGGLAKFDSLANVQWVKMYGGSNHDFFSSVSQTSDNGYVLAGRTDSFGQGGFDIYLVRTDSLGNELFAKTYGGPNLEFGETVCATLDGGFIIGGMKFENGISNYYIIKTDSLGNSGCLESSISSQTFIPFYFYQNFNHIIIPTGQISWQNVSIDSYLKDTILCSSITSNGLHSEEQPINFNIYPNPSNGTINFTLPEKCNLWNYRIISSTGALVSEKTMQGSEKEQLKIQHLDSGIYSISIWCDHIFTSRTFMIIQD